MASQPEHQNLYITTTTISTYDNYTGVVIIDTVWTGTWLGRQIFQDVHHQVIYPEPAPSTTPRPPSSLVRRLNELVALTRGAPPTNTIPDSPVASRQNGLAALVRNNAASARREQAPRNVPYTLGQARPLTLEERTVERVRADLARWTDMNRTSINTNSRGRVTLRPQLLDGVPEVLQRDANYTYIREGRVIRRIAHDPMQFSADNERGNDDTSNTRRHGNRNETAMTTTNLADYSRRRTRAVLRRGHGSADLGESSLLDGEIEQLEGHAALRPSTTRASSDSVDEDERAGQDGA